MTRTRERYVTHVTLTTGHVRRSLRSEVGGEAIALLGTLLDRMLAGETVEIPAVSPACTMRSTGAPGRCLLAEIHGPPDARGSPAHLVTIGVAGHSRCGARLWCDLHAGSALPCATDRDACPPEPWCGVLLHAGLALHPEAAHWLGDLERCLAWAWLERTP